ncbi:MAG: hypothetical protein KME60_11085 [Cyanomargarita calcarea GSE-NOS-MK-12-04C]|jgi:hypothetical protein|uniref:Uncharacterized protein n=1 Tax=Cyanomargarita calcarea GSE-NOS-MK-12-04C TaxID=2839659 RepID=A0A951URU5_9CYAN|nr:hypothetical protein [Cyanomargarita calcarea GSE-NOS-MK-12-04C]
MQAYKLKGKIDATGNLVITEPIQMPPGGDVEVIVLLSAQTITSPAESTNEPEPETTKRRTKIKALQGWFSKTQPTSADFDPDEAKWEALKEKHNL